MAEHWKGEDSEFHLSIHKGENNLQHLATILSQSQPQPLFLFQVRNAHLHRKVNFIRLDGVYWMKFSINNLKSLISFWEFHLNLTCKKPAMQFLNSRSTMNFRLVFNSDLKWLFFLLYACVLYITICRQMYMQVPRLNFVANEKRPIRFGCQKFFMRCSNNIDQSHNLCSSLRTRR
jgi:hypothetical protein